MKFIPQNIRNHFLILSDLHQDERGIFRRSYCKNEFAKHGIDFDVKQGNISENFKKHTLRGFHYQVPPYSQAKLVRVTKGKVLDVVVDIRKNSPTFGKHVAVELSDDNHRQLFIPRGFAHAYVVLSDEAIFAYKVDDYYSKECDKGIIFNDSELNIDWKLGHSKLELAERDKLLPKLNETTDLFEYTDNLHV